jgi:hypothetical protein
VVYDGTLPGKNNRYRVVVSRPYWLSFFAESPHRVAWIAAYVYESGADDDEL